MKPIGLGLIAALAAALAACERVGDPEPIAQGSDLVKRDNHALNGAEIHAYLKNSTLVHEGSQRIWYVYLRDDGTLGGRSLNSNARCNGSGETQSDIPAEL